MAQATETAEPTAWRVGAWTIEARRGPGKGAVLRRADGIVRIGSAPENDLVLDDAKVSRHHVELAVHPEGVRIRDLGSKNGTFYQGSQVELARLPIGGGSIFVGETEIAIAPDDPPRPIAPSARVRCGRLDGASLAMRTLFTEIEQVARSSANVLVHGETGTGKELVAEAIHELGPRADRPLVVVDCGAIPRELIESELFGHVKGAFTGAVGDRRGAFQAADGGSLLLDEIGELPLDLQPKLLRVLETGTVRPVGSNATIETDVRVIAATHRNLDTEVSEGRFRQDLFFRLCVLWLHVPPLRSRPEDVERIAAGMVAEAGAPPFGPDSLAVLAAADWPGNVRQLRNVVDRALALSGGGPPVVRASDLEAPAMRTSPSELLRLPYKEAKDEMVARFTRDYLEALLARHDGKVGAAAAEAGIHRNWIVALARRFGVRVRE